VVNGNVTVLPEEGRPTAGEGPEAAEPAIGEGRGEDGSMGMIMKIDADIDAGDPAEYDGGCGDECDAGRQTVNADETRMLIKPESDGVSE